MHLYELKIIQKLFLISKQMSKLVFLIYNISKSPNGGKQFLSTKFNLNIIVRQVS